MTNEVSPPKVIYMPLANRTKKAKIYADDLERLQTAYGLSLHWFLNSDGKGHAYVKAGRLKNRGRITCADVGGAYPSLLVARVLLGAERGERIAYVDGDRLNLCRDNLRLEKARRDTHGRNRVDLERGPNEHGLPFMTATKPRAQRA